MKSKGWFVIACLLLLCPYVTRAESLTAPQIMDRLEARYNVKGFSVVFHQASSLAALEVNDTAEGRIAIKPPGRMRWEYDTPEKQSIITDGKTVWVYRPEDNQVMTGPSAAFFGKGGGGTFLSDIGSVRKHFTITLMQASSPGEYVLQLFPLKEESALAGILLTISGATFDIKKIVTKNPYGDETTLTFENTTFDPNLPDGLFIFTPPAGIEVMTMSE